MKVTKFTEQGKLFLRAFLLDSSKNVNGWRVAAASIPQRIKTFVGAPLVLTSDYSHVPYDLSRPPLENAQHQERFAIGRITDVVEKGGVWDAIIEVTNPIARATIEAKEIPFYVSPKILLFDEKERDIHSDWAGWHLAIVDRPAYGEKAAIKGECYGNGQQCAVALREAKAEGDCGFCIRSTLEALVNKQSDSSLTSLNPDSPKKQPSMENEVTPKVDLSGFVPKADYEALKAEFTAKAAAFEEARKQDAARLAAIELENTTSKITGILSAKIADKEELAKKVKYFVEAKVAPDIVAEAFRLVPDIQTPQKKDNTELYTTGTKEAKSAGKWYSEFVANESAIIRGTRA